MMKVQLIVVQGKPEGKAIPLTGPSFKIGRGATCQLRPNLEEISREHAEISVSETAVTARDLGSRNGTMLNGKPLTSTPTALKNGDLIQISKLTFALSIQGAPTSAVVPPRPVSLDDVSTDQIDSWLVTDPNRNVPDRPSGVYDGDTLTLNAYKEGSGTHKVVPVPTDSKAATPEAKPVAAAVPAPVKAAPAAAPPPPLAPAPAPVAAVPAAPPPVAPAPAPAVAPAPAPPPPVVAPAPVVVAAPPPPVPAPAPVAAVAAPEPALAVSAPASPSFLTAFLTQEMESLPEGVGDSEEANASASDPETGEHEETSGPSLDDEFMDESNPFYAAKKAQMQSSQQPEGDVSKKDPYKDSSDAANDILRRLTDRRRASR
jgi:hypothetical protein